MKANKRKHLLLLSSLLAGFTTVAALGAMQSVETQAEGNKVGFAMVDGASLRADNASADSTGLRYKVQFDKAHYTTITETDAELHVAIIPYTYYQSWQQTDAELYPWLVENYGLGKFLDLNIPDEKIYEIAGTNSYGANAVMSNVRLNNYHREFIGVAYILDGETYEYAELNEEKSVRSVMYVADKAYYNEDDYEKYGEFLEKTLYKGVYNAYGVKYNAQTGKYSYEGEEYTYEELEGVTDLTSMLMNCPAAAMYVGSTFQLKPTLMFEDGVAYNKPFSGKWTSSDEEVATVDENGVVTALKEGEVEISIEGLGGLIYDYFTVTVEEKPTIILSEDIMFKAKGEVNGAYNVANAVVDLTGAPFAANSVEKVLCDGQEIAFTYAGGNKITLKNVEGGDHTFTFDAAGANYVMGGCAYTHAITNAEEFLAWRGNADGTPQGYYVLLNDVDMKGAVLSAGLEIGNHIVSTLDGRGYKVSNFTYGAGLSRGINGGTVKNIYFDNVTQDCTGLATGHGFFGNYIYNATIENVYLDVTTINLTGEHYGILFRTAITASTAKNVVLEITNQDNKFSYAYAGENAEGCVFEGIVGAQCAWKDGQPDYAGGAKASEGNGEYAPYTYNGGFAEKIDWMIVAEANDELLLFTSPYWTIDTSARTIAMKPCKAGSFTRTVVDVQDVVLAKGNGTTANATGAATLTISGADFSKIDSLTIDGQAFVNYTSSGDTITLNNAAGGDHAVTIKTATHTYNATVCVYTHAITNAEEFLAWRGNADGTPQGYYVLLNDVDMKGAVLSNGSAIGNHVISTLDGRGYKVSNFTYGAGLVRGVNGGSIKNIYFDNVTQDCTGIANGYGFFGNYVYACTIENVYLDITTINLTGEHYGILFRSTQNASAVVRNIVLEITNKDNKFSYAYASGCVAGSTIEGIVGAQCAWKDGQPDYAGGAKASEGNGEYAPYTYNGGFAEKIDWMIANEAKDEILLFTSPYWAIDTVARTIEMKPLAASKPAKVEDGYLVKEGVSAYGIVVDSNADKATRTAATELVTLFKEATGVELRVVSDDSVNYALNAKYISLGANDYTTQSGVRVAEEEIGAQGYKIATKGQNIVIVGQSQGVLYGVYELMSQLFGFEQYTKEIYTLNKMDTAELPNFNIIDKPDVEHRIAFSGAQRNDETARNRMRTQAEGEVIIEYGRSHNMIRYIVPFDEYYKTNPTWYSNKTDSKDTYESTQLCYTAGGYGSANYNAMKAVAVAKIKDIITQNPSVETLSLTQMDVRNMWCNCAGCKAVINQYGANSATQVLFLNDVVTEVDAWLDAEKGGKDVQFLMLAYYETEDAPTGLTLHEDISVWIAPLEGYRTSAAQGLASTKTLIAEWEGVADSVAVWAYGVYFSEYLVPYNNFDQIGELIKVSADANANWMWIQGNWNTTQNTGFDSLKSYLISKLMWDSSLNIEMLTDNFFNAVYGAAAETMKTVYTEMKKQMTSMNVSGNVYDAPCGFGDWNNTYLTNQLKRLESAANSVTKGSAAYDAIICESISFRYIYKENRSFFGSGSDYSSSAWGTFAEDVTRLGFTMLSEQKSMDSYL